MTNRQVKKVCGLSLWFFTLVWVKTVWIIFNGHWPHLQLAKHENMPTPGRSTMKISTRNWRRKNQNEKCQKKYKLYVCVLFWLVACVLQNQASRIFTATEPKWKPGVLNLGQTWARLPKISPRRQKARKNLSIWHSALSFVIEEESSVANGLWVLRLDDLRG